MAKPTIPETIRVGCLTYHVLTDVEAIKQASDNADIGEDTEWTAFSDHDKLIIGINPDNPVGAQRRDVLHEVLHCCLRYAGVWPNTYAQVVARARGKHDGYTVEEFVVAAASAPLLAVLSDNPQLAAWLTAP